MTELIGADKVSVEGHDSLRMRSPVLRLSSM